MWQRFIESKNANSWKKSPSVKDSIDNNINK